MPTESHFVHNSNCGHKRGDEKGASGGVVVCKKKFWTLAYADDIVILAYDEKEIKEVM